MEANNYFAAQFPVPYRILGLRLRPFCLGHYTLLAHPSIECAFVSETLVDPVLGDLLAGVLICSMTYEDGKAFLDSPKFVKLVWLWARRIRSEVSPFTWSNIWKRLRGIKTQREHVFDYLTKAKLFKQYIEEGSQIPKFIDLDDEERRGSGSHWTQNIKLVLMRELHYSESTVMNMPLTQAFSDYYKYSESQGMVRIMTEEEMNEDFIGGTLNGFDSEIPTEETKP